MITLRDIERADALARQSRQYIIEAMLRKFPESLARADELAWNALEAFESVMLLGRVGKMLESQLDAYATDLDKVKQAAQKLDVAVEGMDPVDKGHLFRAMEQRGIDVDQFGEWLETLVEACDSAPKPTRKRRRPPHDTTAGVLRAAECLMQAGVNRAQSARIIETLMTEYQSLSDIKPKSVATIEQTIRNAES